MPKLQLYYRQNSLKKVFEIDLNDQTLLVSKGPNHLSLVTKETTFESKTIARQTSRAIISTQLQGGFLDVADYYLKNDFDPNQLNHLLNQNAFEKAQEWMLKLGEWVDDALEEYYLTVLLQQQKVSEAERYIFTKIKQNKDYEVQIRQIKHLSGFNPIMARLMIGNVPFLPSSLNDPLGYLIDYAKAQARMGVIQHLEQRLPLLSKLQRLVYLVYLLDKIHETESYQLQLLEKALYLLPQCAIPSKQQAVYVSLLRKAATILKSSKHLSILANF